MALQKTHTYNNITVTDAYIKVTTYTGDNPRLYFKVGYHADSNSAPYHIEDYICDLDLGDGSTTFGNNPIKQAYEALKTDNVVEGDASWFGDAADV